MSESVLHAAPECARRAGTWCAQTWQLTELRWLAVSADWLLGTPLKIVFIFLIAFAVRAFAHRLIRRVGADLPHGGRFGRRRNRAPRRPDTPWAIVARRGSQFSERRAQRARTIASLLRSCVSIVVFSLAIVLSLGELGLDLTPLIASAGVLGVAIGFGARNLVQDFLSGVFMLLEDQYGIGDVIDVGEATGTVEAIGLRVTTLRDVAGTVWYVRNGEVVRVGNSSQGHAVAVVDLPVGLQADVARAVEVLAERAARLAAEPPLADNLLSPPEVLGVEQVSSDGLVLRTIARVPAGRQWAVQRTLRAALQAALTEAGFTGPGGGEMKGNEARRTEPRDGEGPPSSTTT